MGIYASASITLTKVIDVKGVYRYYLLQSSTLAKPSKPTTNPPSGWDDVEPTYVEGSTNTLYTVDITVFSDNTWTSSEVSISSSYEAAKIAYNKAHNAQLSIKTLSDSHAELKQNVDGLTSIVSGHTTLIASKADKSEVLSVDTKLTSLEQNLDGFKTTVSSTYANRYDLYRYNLIDKSSDAWTAVVTGLIQTIIVPRTHCSKYGLKAGDQVAFSIELRPEVKNGLKARLDFYSDDTSEDGKVVCLGNAIPKGESGLSSVTATIPDNAQYIVLGFANDDTSETTNTTEYYRKPKFEKGTFSTEWQPAINELLTVGGANYLSNSNIHNSYAALKNGGEYYSSSTSTRQILLFQNLYLEPGTYVMSCYIKQLNGSGNPVDTQTQIRVMKNSTSTFYNSEATSGEWTRCTVPIEVESSSDKYTVYLRTYDSAGVNVEQVWVKKVKVELGTVATDWTPAYADIDSRFTAAETSITQLNNKITANVTETTNLGTRMSTVEQTSTSLTTRLDSQIIGGTNIIRGTNTVSSLGSSSSWSNGNWRAAGASDTAGTRTVIDVSDAPNPLIKKGFEIVGNDTDTNTSQDSVPVTDGLQYTISCYAKGTGTLRLQVGKSVGYSRSDIAISDVTTWTKYSFTFTAGEGVNTLDGATNVYFGNRGTGTLQICGFKMEVGNTASDWTPSPYDLDVAVSNFMKFDSAGLMIADMSDSTIGNNVLIDSDSVDIRKGTTVLASFSANKVILGQNAENSVIDLCDGAGRISSLISEASTSYPHRDSILIDSQEVHTKSVHFKANVSNTYGESSTPTISREAELYMIRSTGSSESCARLQAQHTTNSSGAYTKSGFSAMTYDAASSTRALIFASDSANSVHNQVNVYPTKTTFSKPLYRTDSGTNYAILDESIDSGWINVTSLGSDFVAYSANANDQVKYRRYGKIVEIRGVVKPAAAFEAGDTNRTIFTLPTGYRPSSQVNVKCQGSGANTWLLSITSAGVVRGARYANGTAYTSAGTSTWWPFHATFIID